jgi:N-methylhydantoinase A/oxoprolinase/acetone carboxylase beta subunit
VLLGVDVGGTFTDAVLVGSDARLHTAKVPTTPEHQERGVIEAVHLVLARAAARSSDVERFAHGMTVTTNALLEGRTARTALIATDGFTDVLELGRQARPHLYRLCDSQPPPLVPAELRFAAPERLTPSETLRELDPAAARALVTELVASAPEAVAVALLHSYANPRHEQLLGELIAELLPDARLSLSSRFASTNAPRRPCSTPRSRRCLRATCSGSPATRVRTSCPSRRSCSPPEGSPTSRAPPRTPR